MQRRILGVYFILPLVFAVSLTACQRMPDKIEGDRYQNGLIATGATPDSADVLDDCTDIIRDMNSECEPLIFTEFGALPTGPTDHACAENSGRMERTSYLGWLTPDLVPVLVYLPPCYGDLNQRYPVLYLLHGKPQDEQHWQILGVEDVLDGAYWDDTLPPFLVVMPLQPEPLFSSTDGGPGSYEAEFINGLVPFVDRTYRTIAQGDSRGLAGVSRGGVWALEIGFRNTDVIQRVGALSPALNVNYARPEYDPFGLILQGDMPSKIFFMSGDTDSAYAKTLELSEALRDADIKHKYVLESGNHESSTWRWIIPEMLYYLAADW
ncbi:MAG: alpha/beta hydrolase-fold protein [Anaerolineales bacterium]|nr:alpha/beta hydrolase-fold protein [Anaerolineales bacterium]